MTKKNKTKKKTGKTNLSQILVPVIVILIAVISGGVYLSSNKELDENETNIISSTTTTTTAMPISDGIEDYLTVELIDEEEISTLELEKVREHLSDVNVGSLNKAELAGLYYMEEEEKLAHDIYVALGEMWGIKSFINISQAEATHTNSTVAVLEAYGYESMQNLELGVFHNMELQALYDTLLNDGSVSSQEALLIGGMVEEVDIVDLDKFMAQTDNVDIINLYTNLKRGSENHLRAFVKNYQRSGDVYFPQFLDQDYYHSVVNR